MTHGEELSTLRASGPGFSAIVKTRTVLTAVALQVPDLSKGLERFSASDSRKTEDMRVGETRGEAHLSLTCGLAAVRVKDGIPRPTGTTLGFEGSSPQSARNLGVFTTIGGALGSDRPSHVPRRGGSLSYRMTSMTAIHTGSSRLRWRLRTLKFCILLSAGSVPGFRPSGKRFLQGRKRTNQDRADPEMFRDSIA